MALKFLTDEPGVKEDDLFDRRPFTGRTVFLAVFWGMWAFAGTAGIVGLILWLIVRATGCASAN